ncbi:MAG: YecH family protein [Nibricoccus sp.]
MMNTSIHGHEVIQMMVEAGHPFTFASLREAIVARFGAEARFHTCSADGLTPEGLIEFLGARGKLAPVEGGFVFGAGTPCGHDDHSH